MATVKERIIEYLKLHPEGVDDDMLAEALGFSHRQQANSYCRKLAEEGLVQRLKVKGKYHNFLTGIGTTIPEPVNSTEPNDQPWFWEGNVQARVVEFLEEQGYMIQFVADTASHQAGKDIEAERDNKLLWVTVKGYPKGTAKTAPSTQAQHWFKKAISDIVVWCGETEEADLGLALPDYPTYRNLAKKVSWFHRIADFAYLWVRDDGSVSVESSRIS